jgi:hypothetical protein
MQDHIAATPPPLDTCLRSSLGWLAEATENMVQAQQAQWQMMADWQRSVGLINQDWWDWWASHFGGGVPLDG